MSQDQAFDLLVIGGGINGVGIARDAAGRGLKVLLCEQGDLGQATSSSSSKLIHGGLRYLEHYAFRLVREALIEREVLLAAAPHIIWPLRFVLPHVKELRPAWMLRAGLLLYDHLGGRERLPASQALDLRRDPAGAPLVAGITKGFSYADCWVEDSRLVVLNALDAAERGAEVLTRTRCRSARRDAEAWTATLEAEGGGERRVRARALVNAAGPWVMEVLGQVAGANRRSTLRLIKGSHIVVPRLHDGDEAYILQTRDQRVVFVIPYEGDYSLIGTTDMEFEGDPTAAAITAEETAYLCQAVSRYFKRPVTPENVVWTYAGVRPLYDDDSGKASTVTRDYVFDVDAPEGAAPMLSVFGGKITTYRKLAEHAMSRLSPLLGLSDEGWTAAAALPGGDLPDADFEAFLAGLRQARPWLPAALARRLARAYGSRVSEILGEAKGLADLGDDLGGGLTEAEADYLVRHEWAQTAEDILWRRSKLGLHAPAETTERLQSWLAGHLPGHLPESGKAVAR
ncbi:MAG: glycerol-3-phosphate dehydrogenase [Kiloniellales bacterium]|nr:glycerol-3-phosphate dehydrogenase [Kiloniellales bacterium]